MDFVKQADKECRELLLGKALHEKDLELKEANKLNELKDIEINRLSREN